MMPPPADKQDDIQASLVSIIRRDQRSGHITLAAEADSQADAAFVDLGQVLHWWAYTPLHLNAAGARQLAAALVWWAHRADVAAGLADGDLA